MSNNMLLGQNNSEKRTIQQFSYLATLLDDLVESIMPYIGNILEINSFNIVFYKRQSHLCKAKCI